jgi:hypothetical protein
VNCTSSFVRAEPGLGSSSTELTQLKIVELAPMPSASITTATVAKPGFAFSERNA